MGKPGPGRSSLSEFTRYTVLGAASFVINLCLAATFHEIFSVVEWLAVALSLAIVFVINFIAAKLAVFGSRGRWKRELPRFLVTAVLSRLFEYAMFLVLFASISMQYLLAIAISQVLSFVLKFFVYKRFVFS